MTLEYLREYRAYFHIAQTWGIYEFTAYRIIRSVEDTLVRSRKFRLPGKKKLLFFCKPWLISSKKLRIAWER
ncbi:MAG: transposase family protein [Chroococcidiopsis sp.]